jgi:endonuclease/exonuclease/phosphatase family metal-dependent hydrolase
VLTTVAFPDGPLRLAAVHLASPTSPAYLAARNRQLQELARLLAGGNRPRVVLGDMNITPFSPYFDGFLRHTGMVDARRRQGLHGTWPRWMPPLQIAIDHCLIDPQAPVLSVRRGPDVGSDHYPLEVRLSGATASSM